MEEKLKEYFEVKGQIKTIREDLKDMIDNHPATEVIEKLKKELKEKRETINDEEDISLIKEKIKGLKERSDLLKEIIMAEMKELGETKVTYDKNEFIITENLKVKKVK